MAVVEKKLKVCYQESKHGEDSPYFESHNDGGELLDDVYGDESQETYTIRIFIGGEDGLTEEQFFSFIPLMHKKCKSELLYEFVSVSDWNFETIGFVSVREFEDFVGIFVYFRGSDDCLEIYGKAFVDFNETLIIEILKIFKHEITLHCGVDASHILDAIKKVSASSTEEALAMNGIASSS